MAPGAEWARGRHGPQRADQEDRLETLARPLTSRSIPPLAGIRGLREPGLRLRGEFRRGAASAGWTWVLFGRSLVVRGQRTLDERFSQIRPDEANQESIQESKNQP